MRKLVWAALIVVLIPEWAFTQVIIKNENPEVLTDQHVELLDSLAQSTEAKMREVFPNLPGKITLTVSTMDRDVEIVDGVTGVTFNHKPDGEISVQISTVYPGGTIAAIRAGFETVLYHEFHHLIRGWSIHQNEFEQGIFIATINEGLAVVFAEENTGRKQVANAFPIEAEDWAKEILELPKDADYQEWVAGYHPDGRTFIGYRIGNYIVRKAMENSGKDIVTISRLTPAEIWELAGFEVKNVK